MRRRVIGIVQDAPDRACTSPALQAAAEADVHLHRRMQLGVRPNNDGVDVMVAQHVAGTNDHDEGSISRFDGWVSNDDANHGQGEAGAGLDALSLSAAPACRPPSMPIAKT
jgi:hypothetical protein